MSDVASSSSQGEQQDDRAKLEELQRLVWGSTIRLDVFQRWSQGFEFSEHEPSALVQRQGGPCAVIAPVQAYLIQALGTDIGVTPLKDLPADRCRSLLVDAICSILSMCKGNTYRVVTLPQEDSVPLASEVPSTPETPSQVVPAEQSGASEGAVLWVPDEFHERLTIHAYDDINDVKEFYTRNFHLLAGNFGVLKFMYSVLLTKETKNITAELLDTSEPLIHDTYGCGSQGLINLMITGQAVPHVWDHDKDVGGLRLRGLSQQSDIGFLTLMEQLRYCTVGSFYKNPRHPIWVMASETHLSVLFSNEKDLVSKETPSEVARRVFKSFDPDGNNFIACPVLKDVLTTLELCNDPEYVEFTTNKLDPEGLGIILLNAFMEYFFSYEKRSTPDTFHLLHYNGIPRSNFEDKVQYHQGAAILLESDMPSVSISNPMLTCLQTKWPTIEVTWQDSRTPSLN